MNTLKRNFGFGLIKGLAELPMLKRAVTFLSWFLMRNLLLVEIFLSDNESRILVFSCRNRCNGVDLITDLQKCVKALSEKIGLFWLLRTLSTTLFTDPTNSEYWRGLEWEEFKWQCSVSPSLNLVFFFATERKTLVFLEIQMTKKYQEEDQLS